MNPETYLSKGEQGYSLIHQGMPITHDKATKAECLRAARKMNLNPRYVWIQDHGKFEPLKVECK